jgi:hypothetical protein
VSEKGLDVGNADVARVSPIAFAATKAKKLLNPQLVALDRDLSQMPPQTHVAHSLK